MDNCYKVTDCNTITLQGIKVGQGAIIPVQCNVEVPFNIARVYYLYDIPGGESRGGHAHKNLEQFIIAVTGSFDIALDDGSNTRIVQLNRSNMGLHLRPGIWGEISNFSSGAICLAFASSKFDESDYIRDYNEFKACYGAN